MSDPSDELLAEAENAAGKGWPLSFDVAISLIRELQRHRAAQRANADAIRAAAFEASAKYQGCALSVTVRTEIASTVADRLAPGWRSRPDQRTDAERVRAVVREAFAAQLDIVHGRLSLSDGPAIADRVAAELAIGAAPVPPVALPADHGGEG